MKRASLRIKTIALMISALTLAGAAACSSQSDTQSASAESAVSVQSDTASETASTASETTSTASETASTTELLSGIISTDPESSVTYGTEEMNHPYSLVGKWSLKLDTTDLDASTLELAKERMANTSIILNADGSAVGVYGTSNVQGAWGLQSGYVYVVLGDATEVFEHYLDTLISTTYDGMSFVK